MSNLMIYLIFNIGKISMALIVICIALVIIGVALLSSLYEDGYLISDESDSKEITTMRKVMKISLVLSIVIFVIGMILPSKETLIAMQVKNLATMENYNWTVEQLKGVVDYIVEAINKVGK